MKVDRRTFMKGVGSGCVVGTFGSWGIASLGQAKEIAPIAAGKTIGSICEMCSYRCPISAQVVEDKAIFIHGNPHAPQQKERICARGASGTNMLYDPNRIVHPMKRVGPRGSDQWEIITWETAYKEIAQKMNDIKEKYGAPSMMFSSKSGSLASHLYALAKAFGSPNTFTHASTCPGGYATAASVMMGGNVKMDHLNTNYTITFGHNLYEGIEVAETNQLMQAQERGAKVVSFDPRLSIVSSKADEWHAIRPGSDLAVLLAMCHVLIKEDLYDKDFIARFTSGFDSFAQSVQNYTPEWAEQQSDIPAKTIVRIAREIAAAAPHAFVSYGHRTTYTPQELDFRRTIFAMNALLGCYERKGGLFQTKGAGIYNKLAGEKVAPTLGKVSSEAPPEITTKRIDEFDTQYKYISKGGGISQQILVASETSNPYPVKGWIMSRQNILQTMTDREKIVQAFERMELLVSCDVYMTESASYADYFLPDTTYLERDEDVVSSAWLTPAYALRQSVVEPIGNTKPSWLIWKELAQELGLGQYYTWGDMDNRIKAQLNHDEPLYQELREKGYLQYGEAPLYLREPEAVAEFVKHYPAAQQFVEEDGTFSSHLKFKSPSTLIELASPTLEALAPGYETMKYRDTPMKKDNELFFLQGKVAVHTNGATQYIPILANLMRNNSVWIHPQTANKHNIQTGDFVWIYNDTGREKGKALVTTATRPDTVFVYMGGGAKAGFKTPGTHDGIHCGNLLPHKVSPVTGTNVHTTGVLLEKA